MTPASSARRALAARPAYRDVYKRQEQHCAHSGGGDVHDVVADEDGGDQPVIVLHQVPVSYTHLDVYKRQLLTSLLP